MWAPRPACPAGVDDSFGPWAGTLCRGGFDFTLLFEESILAVPLHCLLLLALPVRALHLAKSEVKVVASIHRPLKACAAACLVALNLALLVLWATTSITNTRATIPTAVLGLLASLAFCLLSWLEHDRSVRPSFVLSTYLSLSVLLDTARARTLWMLAPDRTIPAVLTCALALRAAMIVIESTEKRRILVPEHKGYSREVTSGTFNRSVFFWLTSLFINGYRNILKLDDLYPLDPKLASEPLCRKLAEAWDNVPDKTVPGALFSTWLRVFSRPLCAAVIPKLFQIGFNYAQPFLIQEAILLAALPQTQEYNNRGFGLIGAYVLVYTGIACAKVSTGQYDWQNQRVASMMRGSTTALIYQKALRLDLTSPNVSPSGALTLVGTDSEQISQGIHQLHELWGGLLEIGIGIYLIYRQLGAACAMPVALAFLVLIVTGFLAVPMGKASANWIKASQDRVTATSNTLGSIKWLKVSGLNDVAFSVIRRLRSDELVASKRFRVLLSMTMMLMICTPIWSPILTFATFAGIAARNDDVLTISKAFTASSVLILVNQPLSGIVMSLPALATAVTSFQRIQDFLNGKERLDNRVTPGDGKRSIEVPNEKGASKEAAPDMELSEIHKDTSTGNSLAEGIVASVKGSFSWSDDARPVIDIEGWNIRRRAFTLVLGPVGCGKSTLIKALLGELSDFKGTVRINASGVTYCGQSAWIPNETVRNIITGHGPLDEPWYKTVLAACALEQDIASWPKGDLTVAGTRGISMSGGQKHRLAMARAVYARQELVLLDDVFSGLDSGTEDLVFRNLIGSDGLLRNTDTTVVLVSSDSHRIPYADDVVFLNEHGQIKAGERASLEALKTVSATRRDTGAETASGDADRTADTAIGALEEQADATRQLGDWSMYAFYARAAGWFSLSMFIGFMAFKWGDAFEKTNMGRLDNSQRPSYLLACLQRWLTFSVDMTITVMALILIVLVTTLREQIGPAFIGIALNNVLSFSATIKAVITSWVTLEVSLGAVARVRNFAANVKPEGHSDGPLAEPDGEWPTKGAIEFNDVTASYPSGGTVLKGVSMSIQPGQKVAICGRTGSGKSSLVLCLLRMLDLDAGSIAIDGIDLSSLPHEYVRSSLVAVPQESYVFDGTVRLNLDPGQSVPDTDVVEALKRVRLWDKVEGRGGLDAVIDGGFLSQGEAQLLVFARAMLRKSKVLILDEITSSLDEESSHVVDDVLRTWFKDWTIVAIAHKLESVLDFDRVAVVDAGALVELGEPRQLLEKESAFKALYERSRTSEKMA
ncbi:ABC multidrug transporter [Colletotrichum musicola]|uniref:ABC multidrug transporter n=1 Tax=Colletotrichum musicola TaxID=2175873 RepID=A0A8H6KM57_9PEZI|nr:ABC multidrug transporter [Colletotrichum musicola]